MTYQPVDVKLIVMEWLKSVLDVPVVSTRPDGKDAPSRFVRVIPTGGQGRHGRVLQGIGSSIMDQGTH